MKRNLYKFVAFLATAALANGSLAAQPISYKRSFGLPPGKTGAMKTEISYPLAKPTPLKANAEGGHKLTIKLKFGEGYPNDQNTMWLNIQNKEVSEVAFAQPGETEAVVTNLPAGTYDILTSFSNHDDPKYPQRYVIKENVKVYSDTEVTLSSDDATVHLQFDYKNPKGEEITVNEAVLSDDGMSMTITKKGNSQGISLDSRISPKEYSGGFMSLNSILGDLYADFDIRRTADIYISPLSDRWMITNVYAVEDNENTKYIIKYRQDGASESKHIVNDPSQFIAFEEKFLQSPAGKATGKTPRFGHKAIDINGGYIDGASSGVGTELPSDGFAKFYIDALDDTESKNPTWQIRLQPLFADFEDGNTDYIYRTTDATPVYITKEGVKYEVVGDIISDFNDEKGPFYLVSAYKPHKAFSYTASQKSGEFGGSAPVVTIGQCSYTNEDGTKLLGFDKYDYSYMIPTAVFYTGRLGEKRYTDLDEMEFSLKYNGKEILNDFSKLSEFSMQWDSEKHADGAYNITMLNENIEVDGVKGKNYTMVDFDFRKEDCNAPTLTMLQFRNGYDLVTDRFDNAADGKIMLSAGDFTYNYIPEEYGGLFTCKPAKVAVEYSPYGNDTWLPLDIEENAEYYQAPGFGNYYEGSLSKVATNGWHDVRITVTDDAGNRQQQVISPAFKIGSDAGISAASANDGVYAYMLGKSEVRIAGAESAEVSIYNASGALVAHSADGVANPVSIASLPSGVYVAQVSAPGKNVVTAKLIK